MFLILFLAICLYWQSGQFRDHCSRNRNCDKFKKIDKHYDKISALISSQMYDRRDLGVWIGLRDSGDWTWVDQEVATWTNWAPDEPANVGIDWHNK